MFLNLDGTRLMDSFSFNLALASRDTTSIFCHHYGFHSSFHLLFLTYSKVDPVFEFLVFLGIESAVAFVILIWYFANRSIFPCLPDLGF